jgi:hypothetical protein
MLDLRPSQKGAVAEAAITLAAIRMNLVVLRPLCGGSRYDLVIDLEPRLLRVQCKWASRNGDVLTIHCQKSRHTPNGYLRTTYSASEVDAIAAYSPDIDRCYVIPIKDAEHMSTVSLRLAPTRNNQALNVRWARDYEFESSLRRHWLGPEDDVPVRRPPDLEAIR